MNIAEILKDAPKGTTLYSPLFGTVILEKVEEDDEFPIKVYSSPLTAVFKEDGKYFANRPDAECMLFPSKENRDWSTFDITQYKVFKPGQMVIVPKRLFDNNFYWTISYYSHLAKNYHIICDGTYYSNNRILPFEGNEDKVGTLANIDLKEDEI